MNYYAYLECEGEGRNCEIVAKIVSELPVLIEGTPMLGYRGDERRTTHDMFLGDIDQLPCFCWVEIDEDVIGEPQILSPGNADKLTRSKRSKGAKAGGNTGITLDGKDVEFVELSANLDQKTWGSCKDQLLGRKTVIARYRTDAKEVFVWESDPSYDEWIAERNRHDYEEAAKKMERSKRSMQERLQKLHDGGDAFINPYTFVPLPAKVKRSSPNGHSVALKENFTGLLRVRFTLKTPMMLPFDWRKDEAFNSQNDQDFGHGEDSPTPKVEQQVSIPGSSIKGAVRSLFEVMTDSCLSIIDPDYLPVHRSGFSEGNNDRLAVVTEVDEMGVPIRLRLSSKVVWVPMTYLHKLWGKNKGKIALRELRSGLRITLDEKLIEKQSFGRAERDQYKVTADPDGNGISLGGDWVVHIADAGPKEKYEPDHIFAAVGKLDGPEVLLDREIWNEYRELCRYSADVSGGNLETRAPEWDSVEWPGCEVSHKHKQKETKLAQRRKSDGTLAEKDSIWAILNKNRIIGLKVSFAWREFGKHPLRERLPKVDDETESLLPCTDPRKLCPACAVFGFIEPRTENSQQNGVEQNAYASHVRFGEFVTDGKVTIEQILPPPMRSPRPSAGNFYLAHPNAEGEDREYGKEALGKSSARWGAADSPVRQIAGRKFYWHGQEPDDTKPTPRHVRREHYPAEGTAENKDAPRWFIPAGTSIEGDIAFENLTTEQLQYLLAAIEPQRLVKDGEQEAVKNIATHIGGGKGLGYGTTTVKIVSGEIETATGRYLSEGVELDSAELLEELPPIDSDAARFKGLVDVLTQGKVSADRIWYPTMGNFNHRGSDEEKKAFDESHKFYAKFSGANRNRMRTLPPIADQSQYMSNREKNPKD